MPTLDWINRDAAYRIAEQVPTRVLRPHDTGHANGDAATGASGSRNLLIQGDNLQALKALLPFYRGLVKCIFIDPPYNTRSAFEHFDDNLEHSQRLSMMLPRLQLLREDGSIWVNGPGFHGGRSARRGPSTAGPRGLRDGLQAGTRHDDGGADPGGTGVRRAFSRGSQRRLGISFGGRVRPTHRLNPADEGCWRRRR